KAACEALKTHPELKFLIVGGGSLKESLAALAVDLKIEDNVIFAPPCRDITGYLNITDINVILSKYGGKSAVLRSMSLNLPSIVSDDMLSLEIVEDGVNGLVFERGNSETLYTAMITLAENSELTDRLGDISGKMFDNKFSALRVAKAYEDLYANVFS
ncbi:MAG: glycosyltransferase, partial [Clostridia bacterium]|nr:glycosyltransferase [Clostridia bacterium]